jgi:hypothetical protein
MGTDAVTEASCGTVFVVCCWFQHTIAASTFSIPMGTTNGGSHGVFIHQHQDLHRRRIGPIGEDMGYGSSRRDEENSLTWCPAATIWWSTISIALLPTSLLCGLQKKADLHLGEWWTRKQLYMYMHQVCFSPGNMHSWILTRELHFFLSNMQENSISFH